MSGTRRLVIVGTEKGIWQLWGDASGSEWRLEGPILKGWKVLDVTLDRRREPTLYAAVGSYVYGPTVQISRDWGNTWTQVEHGPAYPTGGPKLNNIWTVIPGCAAEPDTVYAGVDEAGIFVSRDGGIHWEDLAGLSGHATRAEWVPGNGGLCCHSIIVHPTNPERMWVGISAVGVLRTDDAGATWQVRNDGLEIIVEAQHHKEIGSCVHRMVIDPRNPGRLYQQNHRGVFRSDNGGDSWTRIENGLPGTFGFPMVIHPHQPETLFIILQESDEFRFMPEGRMTVWRSTDGGGSWSPLRDGFPGNCYTGVLRQAMAMDDSEAGGIYFGTSSGQVFASTDNGEHWKLLPCTLPRINSVHACLVE